MNKFKKLLAGMLTGVSALACVAMVGTKVNAVAPNCSYDVTDAGKTAKWDFTTTTLKENYTIKTMFDSNVDGLGGSSNGKVAVKYSDKKISNGTSGTIYVPVPSATSAGTISSLGNRTDKARYVLVGESKLYDDKNTEQSVSFTAANVKLDSTTSKYYVELAPGAGEIKLQYIKVTLTSDDAYGATAAKITVTIKDTSGNTLKTVNTVESGKAYTDGYICWGNDVELYTDAEFTHKYNNTALTEDTVLYAKLIPWNDVESNKLTSTQIGKIAGIDCSSNVELTGTMYTILKNCSVSSTHILTVGGVSSSEKGIKVVVPTAGTLTVDIANGGSDNRNAKLIDSSSVEVTAATGDIGMPNAGSNVITYNLEAGTYYFGGTNSIKIFSMSFAESAAVEVAKLNAQFDNDAQKNAVRFIGTIVAEDLTKVTDIKITLTLSDNPTPAVVDFTTVYTSVSHLTGFGEAENTYYIILKITNLVAYRNSTLNAKL